MDNRRHVPPERAAVSLVVAVAIAVVVMVAAVVTRHHIGRLRTSVRTARGRTRVAQRRVLPNLRRLRLQLEHDIGWVVQRSASLSAADMRLETWLTTLERGRTAIERIKNRQLVPAARLVRLVETIARYAVLWRNPLG
jgi:hypothetical protein